MITLRSIKPGFIIKTVVFSLVLIAISGQIIDWLFFYESKADLAHRYQKQFSPLVLLLEHLEPQQLEAALSKASAALETDMEILSAHDLHINSKHGTGNEFEPFFSTNKQEEVFLYQKTKHGLLKIGPLLPAHAQRSSADLLINIGFYCLILLVIVFFLLPLAIDLDKLNQAATEYRINKGFENLNINAKSPIYPLAQTFQTLVKTIAEMLHYQSAMHRTVSHELRTPLSRIKFSLALLDKEAPDKQDQQDQQDQQYLETIRFNIDALEQLIDQMLEYGKIENTKDLLRPKKIHPDTILDRITQEFNDSAYATQIEFDFCQLPEAQLINADANLLFIAMSNILQNAIVHANNRVKISTAYDLQMLYIIIDDDGSGISIKAQEHLYRPFSETTQHKDGSKSYGLGLAISKHILDLHNGHIRYEKSAALGGARFTMMLPLINSQSRAS